MSLGDDGHFFVEPAESLVFAPPRSFSAGEAHHIRSDFPPTPQTFQGLVRTRLLYGAEPPFDVDGPNARDGIAGLVGAPDALPAGWQLRGPFPARRRTETDADGLATERIEPWLPTPRFLLRNPEDGAEPVPCRPVRSGHPALSDLADSDACFVGRPDLGRPGLLGGWIGPRNLAHVFGGGRERTRRWDWADWHADRPPFVRIERQPGLVIEPGQATARHDMLYFAEALRLEAGGGFLGRLDGFLAAPLRAGALSEGAGQAGRKGRLVRFWPVEDLHPDWESVLRGDHLPKAIAEQDRFWLVAVTPVRLDDAEGNPNSADAVGTPGQPVFRTLRSAGVAVRVEAALVGPPLILGGFDLSRGRPRPNRAYVPAGSAWLIGLTGGRPETRADALRSLHDRHPLGRAAEAAMGFGHTLVALGPRETAQQKTDSQT